MKKLGIITLVGAVIVLGAALAVHASDPNVSVETVSTALLQPEIYAVSVLEPRDGTALVRPRISGTIIAVSVNEGEAVKAGQELAIIESEGRQAELRRRIAERNALAEEVRLLSSGAIDEQRRSVEADLNASRAQARAADANARHLEELARTGSGSHAAAEQARLDALSAEARSESLAASSRVTLLFKGPSDLRAARERLAAAEAQVEVAERDASSGKIVSTVDGIVLGRHCNVGDVVAEAAAGSAPIFEIGDTSKLTLRTELDELELERVTVGLPVRVHSIASNDQVAEGRLVRLGARVQRRTIGWADPREPLVRTLWSDIEWTRSERPPIGERFELRIRLKPTLVTALAPREAVKVQDGVATVDVRWGPLWRTIPVQLGRADAKHVELRNVQAGTSVRVRHN